MRRRSISRERTVRGRSGRMAEVFESEPSLGPIDEAMMKRVRFQVKGESFLLCERYQPVRRLGKGSSGIVVSAKDKERGGHLRAIKKIPDCFRTVVEARRLLREIKMLSHFEHPNLVKLHDIVNPVTMSEFEDVYLVLDYMQSDLTRIIQSENQLSNDHISWIAYQVFLAIDHLHASNVIHRDVKPANILINADCSIKLCDFGLSRGFGGQEALESEEEMTEYVVTRHYRAPEVVVSAKCYGSGVDVWGAGCILAELYTRHAMFPGDNYLNQLEVILKVTGTPSKSDLDNVKDPSAFKFLSDLPKQKKANLSHLIPNAPKHIIDLLSQVFQFNPKNRISARDALKHKCFRKFYKESHLFGCESAVDFGFEKLTRTEESIRSLVFSEIVDFRPWAYTVSPIPVDIHSSSSSFGSLSSFERTRSLSAYY